MTVVLPEMWYMIVLLAIIGIDTAFFLSTVKEKTHAGRGP